MFMCIGLFFRVKEKPWVGATFEDSTEDVFDVRKMTRLLRWETTGDEPEISVLYRGQWFKGNIRCAAGKEISFMCQNQIFVCLRGARFALLLSYPTLMR